MTGRVDSGVRIAACALGLLAGTALQLQQPAAGSAAVAVAILVAGLVLVAAGWRRAVAPVVLGLALLAFGATALRAQHRLAERLAPALEGRDLVLTGVVAGLPHRQPEGVRFAFAVEQATQDGQAVAVPSRVLLGWYGGWQEEALLLVPWEGLAAGQRWRFAVRLKRPHGSLNPHGFDTELWLFEQRLGATGAVRAVDGRGAQRLDRAAGAPVERARQAVRDAIERRVPDARAAGVLAALAVGDQAAIDRADWDVFRATGIAHLVSISGLHVTMFAWLAGALVGWAWRRSPRLVLAWPAPAAARWGGLLAAAAYALLAGWGVPAQRTVWMLAAAALLAQLGLRWPWPLVLLVVAAWVALLDPWALLQPGFWLSFAAVGLLVVAQRDEAPAAGRGAALWRAARRGLRTQVIASVGLAPLTLLFFQQVSVVGLLANLVAVPLVTLVVTPLALAGVLVPPLWSAGAACVQLLVHGLQRLAEWPLAVWTAAAAPWWMQAAALVGAALLVLRLPWSLRALALPLMLPLFAPPVARPAEGAMQVVAADVGQGSAILVRTRGHALLHDTGTRYTPDSDAGSRVLVPLLRALGVARLDLLVLSHRDSDHVGGAAAVMAALPVAALSSSLEAGHPLRDGRAHTRCEAGQSWRWDGVHFAVLHPPAGDYALPDARPNALSCVLAVTDAQGHRLLLTGDLEAEQEQRLVREHAAALRSAALLVPHHGSRTSSTPDFVAAVAPSFAVVQAGYRNRFGHPAPEVERRYVERGIALVRSDRCGAWQWSPGTAPVCQRRAGRRYWHHADGAELASPPERP